MERQSDLTAAILGGTSPWVKWHNVRLDATPCRTREVCMMLRVCLCCVDTPGAVCSTGQSTADDATRRGATEGAGLGHAAPDADAISGASPPVGSVGSKFSIAPSGLRLIIHQQDGGGMAGGESGRDALEASVISPQAVQPGDALPAPSLNTIAAATSTSLNTDAFSGVLDRHDSAPTLVAPAPLLSSRGARRIVFFREAPPLPAVSDDAARPTSSFTAGASSDPATVPVSEPGTDLAAGCPTSASSGLASFGFHDNASLDSSAELFSVNSTPAGVPPLRRQWTQNSGIASLGRLNSSDSLTGMLSPASVNVTTDSPRALPPLPLQRSASARFGSGVAMLSTATGELVAPSRRHVVAPALARSLSDRELDLSGRSQDQSSRTYISQSTNSAR